MPDSKQQAHTLITYFQKEYLIKFNKKAIVNRNKLQNLVVNMLKDLTLPEAKQVVDFYIRTDRSPTMLYLCYEYDEVLQEMKSHEKDLEQRKALMRQTQNNVEEFRRRYGAG